MTIYQPGDIVLLSFPFTEGTQSKNRPALIVLDTGDEDVVLARITTQNYQTTYDYQVKYWQESGLLAPSTIRLHKIATVDKSLINRPLGKLNTSDREQVFSMIHKIYQNIVT